MMKWVCKNLLVLGISILAGFLLLLLVHLLPTDKMRENVYWSKDTILAEFDDQQVIDGYEATMTGSFTDCLMLEHAIYRNEEHSALEQAMRMYRGESCPEGGDAWWPGQSLVDYLDGVEQPVEAEYARYWHGYLVLLKPLLMITSLNGLRMLGALLFPALLGAVLMVCCYQRKIGLGMAVVAALPFLFFGTSFMSLSLSVCLYLMLGAVLAVLLTGKKEKLPILFLLVGILTAYFDFLTYPLITLCFPLCAALYGREDSTKAQWKAMAVYSLEWCVGYAVMWGSKWILADICTGGHTIKDALQTVFTRAGSARGVGRISGFAEVLRCNLAPFMNVGFALFMMLFIVCLIWKLMRHGSAQQNGAKQCNVKALLLCKIQRMSVFFGVAVMPLVWWFVMQNHSQEHWAYTCRNFAIVVLALVAAVL